MELQITRHAVRNKCPLDDDDVPLREKIVFCTSCGDMLEDFCFSPEAEDLAALREHIAECKKNGRFSGDVCARFFIARSNGKA